ncbi:SprT-like family-domain-containing protein [Polychytrium aggregatum]|uniref:SprT-like family-domain-containing protein n=1 Tax=Polychytrium aggregatum TaxID=110093 RepID=UPI0022FEB5B6|nr:SprT-like family-domain-containing protein [Polychytrium aggregatum]KAI9204307.1 SprT-like family-domain-containing protein [Polychytrium aggregatum]
MGTMGGSAPRLQASAVDSDEGSSDDEVVPRPGPTSPLRRIYIIDSDDEVTATATSPGQSPSAKQNGSVASPFDELASQMASRLNIGAGQTKDGSISRTSAAHHSDDQPEALSDAPFAVATKPGAVDQPVEVIVISDSDDEVARPIRRSKSPQTPQSQVKKPPASPISISDSDDEDLEEPAEHRIFSDKVIGRPRSPETKRTAEHAEDIPVAAALDDKTENGNESSDSYGDEELSRALIGSIIVFDGTPRRTRNIKPPLDLHLQDEPPKPQEPRVGIVPMTPRTGLLAKFKRQRESLAIGIYKDANCKVFGDQLPQEPAIVWSVKLNTTAGRCHQQMKTLDGRHVYSFWIELSTKVIDDEVKLRATLIHEMCHAASWYIDHVNDNHGKVFKGWGNAAQMAFADIQVTTCHNYEISYKYWYECKNDACKARYGRHSKSIDLDAKGCGRCGSRLKLLDKLKRDGTPYKKNGFQVFMKDNMKKIKTDNVGASHKQIMEILVAEYQKMKVTNEATGA